MNLSKNSSSIKKEFLTTIVAPATPPGKGGVAIIRISGPLVRTISKQLFNKLLQPRYASFHIFYDEQGQAIDEGLALFFPAPNSFTGEDILELQGHGSPITIDRLIQRILSLGAIMAKPGEFSERAFLNNKLDLVQAEAIADLIEAHSEQAARASIRSLQGEFSKKIHELVDLLIHLRMYIEAAIDFVEEEINFLTDTKINNNLTLLINKLTLLQESALQGSLLREGITAVIAGAPNVGKSSLLNHLSGKDIAIVTEIPGTTRDVLREHIILDSIPIHFIDTAGLRITDDLVEQEGIKRAHQEISNADLILHIMDAHNSDNSDNHFLNNINLNTLNIPIITIRNKIDLTQELPSIIEENKKTIISISIKENLGIDLLKNTIKSMIGFKANQEGIFSARRRHLDALKKAKDFILMGQQQLHTFKAVELLAEDLRQAQLTLNEITGEFTSDDLLGRIFSSFCIGK